MSFTARMFVACLLGGYVVSAMGLPWDQDMVDQPGAKPQRSEAPPAPGSVPVHGAEIVPSPTTQAAMYDAKDAAVSILNPTPASAESIDRGNRVRGRRKSTRKGFR